MPRTLPTHHHYRFVAAKLICPALLITLVCLLGSCTSTREEAVVAPTPQPTQTQTAPNAAQPAQPTTAASPTQSATPKPVAPPPAEINDKLTQIFQGAAQFDATQPTTTLVGDFNGDGSEDIAIILKPAADKLADINSEVANWILEDPHQVALPDPTKTTQKLPAPATPVKVQANDTLLTVIHGFKETGWRNPEARQTYLLKNAVGRDLRVETRAEALAAHKPLPLQLRGDIINEEMAQQSGFLYWTGAKYAWRSHQAKEKQKQ